MSKRILLLRPMAELAQAQALREVMMMKCVRVCARVPPCARALPDSVLFLQNQALAVPFSPARSALSITSDLLAGVGRGKKDLKGLYLKGKRTLFVVLTRHVATPR